MNFNRSFENQLMEYFQSMQSYNKIAVLNLGGISGPGGGSGGPPGGIIGQLAQIKVTYDTTELASNYTPPSGRNLVHNLNHIRYRLGNLETASGTIAVQDDGVTIISNAKVLNFIGGNVTFSGDTANITMSGGGSASYLTDLLDVTITTPASGESLIYDGLQWINSIASTATTFLQLTDTPNSYLTASGNLLIVNGTESGIEFADYSSGFTPKEHTHYASGILTNVATFNKKLSSADTNVQLALNTLDDHTHTLDDLSDVAVTSPTEGQFIAYSGGGWINQSVTPGNNAPANASYLVLGTDASLTNERVLTPGNFLKGTNNGAGNTYVIDLDTSFNQTELVDEFMAGGNYISRFGELGWNRYSFSNSEVVSIPSGIILNHPGILKISTTGSTNNYTCLSLGISVASGIIVASDIESFSFLFRVNTPVAETKFQMGAGNNFTSWGMGFSSAALLWDGSVASFVTGDAELINKETTSIGDVIAQNTWYLFKFIRETVSGNWSLYQNDTQVASHTTKRPSMPVNLGLFVQYLGEGGGAGTIELDWFKIKTKTLGNRY